MELLRQAPLLLHQSSEAGNSKNTGGQSGPFELSIGIDPGWKNLGLSVVMEQPNFRVKVLGSETLNPSVGDYKFIARLPWIIKDIVERAGFTWHGDDECVVRNLVLERYVPYNNTFGTETENITMLIGMLRERFVQSTPVAEYGIPESNIFLYRAIDWKSKLAQLMSKHAGFHNPSISLDKKYSLAMARFLTRAQHVDPRLVIEEKGHKLEPSYLQIDHEADATCLAALPIVAKQLNQLAGQKVIRKTDEVSVGATGEARGRGLSRGSGSPGPIGSASPDGGDTELGWPDSALGG